LGARGEVKKKQFGFRGANRNGGGEKNRGGGLETFLAKNDRASGYTVRVGNLRELMKKKQTK